MDQIVITEQNEIAYNQDRAIIDSQVATAKAYPRDIRKATEDSIYIVTMDKETAQSCTYSLPRGGKAISGPSVHMARIIVQQWGNVRAESKVVEITNKHVVSQAVCYDLQSNVAVKVEVKRSIMTKNGRMNDDMITVTGNAANAIAYRNAVYSVIPKSVVDKVYKSAMSYITGDISDEAALIKKRNQVVDALKSAYGLTEEEILLSIGKSKLEYIGRDEIVILIGAGTAIKDGDSTVDEIFRPHNVKKSPTERAEDKENDRILVAIKSCVDKEQLKAIAPEVATEEQRIAYKEQEEKLKKG